MIVSMRSSPSGEGAGWINTQPKFDNRNAKTYLITSLPNHLDTRYLPSFDTRCQGIMMFKDKSIEEGKVISG